MHAAAGAHEAVQTDTEIGPSCTLVEMARLQGEGTLRSPEPAVFENRYVRREDGCWMISAVERSA